MDHALLVVSRGLGQRLDLLNGRLGQPLHLGQQRRRILVREGLPGQRPTSSSHRSNLSRSLRASATLSLRFRSSSALSIFFFSSSRCLSKATFPSRFQSGSF